MCSTIAGPRRLFDPSGDNVILQGGFDIACPESTDTTDSPTFTLDDEAPVFDDSDIERCADAGGCTSIVDYAAVTDNCGTPTVDCDPPSGSEFAVGTTTVECSAEDDCGNTSTWDFDVTINPCNVVNIEITLQGNSTTGPDTRCIKTVGDECSDVVHRELLFTDGVFDGQIEIACDDTSNLCVKDEQHTLYETSALTDVGTEYNAAAVTLKAGDTNNDSKVNIFDASWLSATFGDPHDPGGCPWNGDRDADFNNSGTVNAPDHSLMASNWQAKTVCACGAGLTGPDDAEDVKVQVLIGELPTEVGNRVDLVADGVFDHRDVFEFERLNGLPHTLSAAIQATARAQKDRASQNPGTGN